MLFGPKQEPVGWNEIADDVKSLTDQEPNYNTDLERILCSDDNCIGLVGKDGYCRVCGMAYEGDMEITEEAGTDPAAASEEEYDEEYEDAYGDESEDEHDDEDDFDDRILCSDESCIGLVGEDGCCKYCGLLYKEDGYAEDEEWVYREDEEDEPSDEALADEEDSSGEEPDEEDSGGEEPDEEKPSEPEDKETR